jgi:DNA-binding LacI/PurR family transcriptional regulator/serine phosphatase RsbU (regulator of sigma subunit)
MIWSGASDAAKRLGYSLVCFAGGSLDKAWNEFEPQRNAVYNFIDKNQLNGIVISGSLGNFISESKFKEFYNQFINILPSVCLGPEIPSVPNVIVDNTQGMHELISHLVEFHKRRHIAFVCGPNGNKEAEKRLSIFKEVLNEHEITIDEQLIIPGDFSRDAGVNAVKYLLENNLCFDALVAANDDMALGALRSFKDHTINVPEKVLVVGFDDIEECNFSEPPLTTIKQPLYEMGSRAIEVIHDCIEGRKSEHNCTLPAPLIPRQSCGCIQQYVINDAIFENREQLDAENLRIEITKLINSYVIDSKLNIYNTIISDLVTSFTNEFLISSEHRFLNAIGKSTWEIVRSGKNATVLFHVLAIMRQYATSLFEGQLPKEAENLLYNASIVISSNSARALENRNLARERQSMILHSAGQEIASAFDVDHLLEVIAKVIIKLEIGDCYLSLYERDTRKQWPSQLNLKLFIKNGKKITFDPTCSFFTVPRMMPDGMIVVTEPHSFLIEPLYFREEQIGIIVFDVKNCCDGLTYEILQQHISSALKGALLMKQVQEQSTDLESANQQLYKLRVSEHVYLEDMKRQMELGREIQNSFLPRDIPKIPGWDIETSFQPARDISGDFYDIFTLPDGKLVIITCDISGNDISAALYMALIQTLLRALAEQAIIGVNDPLDAVALTNKYLINHQYGSKVRHMYATLFMAVVGPETDTIKYVNAGYNQATLISKKGDICTNIQRTGPGVGIIAEADFIQKSLHLESEDIVLLYSNGLTEARNPKGLLFPKKRLSEILSSQATSATELITRIKDAVTEHTDSKGLSHDVTMVAIRKVI